MEEQPRSGCLTDQGVEVIVSAAVHALQVAGKLGLVTGSTESRINHHSQRCK